MTKIEISKIEIGKIEIKKIFDDLNEATQEFWEVSRLVDNAQLKKQSAYKKLQLARIAAHSIKFD